jgi:uncharacterized lipoprotein YbaY
VVIYSVQSVSILKGRVVPANKTFAKDQLDGTTLVIKIEDVSVQDIGSVLLASRSIKLNRHRQFPLNFEIVYPKQVIDSLKAGSIVAISASIVNSITSALLYVTDTQYPLPKLVQRPIELKVIKVQENIRKWFIHLSQPALLKLK